jgi:hypothetical protein
MVMKWHPHAILVSALLLGACANSSTAPSTPDVPVPTGTVVLRVGFLSACAPTDGTRLFPEVRTRITVTQSGSEWIGTSSNAAGGDVQLRFHATRPGTLGTLVEGTIAGTVIHQPELVTLAPWDSRIAFANTVFISGVAFGPGALSTTNGVDGTGTGPITLSDSAGRSCSGSTFTWAIFP